MSKRPSSGLSLGHVLLALGVSQIQIACKERGGPAPSSSHASPSATAVAPTPKPALELPAIDDNSALGASVDGVSVELRSLRRHATLSDPLGLVFRIRPDSELGRGDPRLREMLDLAESLKTFDFTLTDPQGKETALRISNGPTAAWSTSMFSTDAPLELTASGLLANRTSLAWVTPPTKLLTASGTYKLRIAGELVSKTRRVKFESGSLTFEAVGDPKALDLSALQAAAADLVMQRQGLKAAPSPRTAAIEDSAGNRSFRFELSSTGYDVTIVEVTLSSAGKEVLYDVYEHFTCVAEGTPIETPRGPVPVQQLLPGSEVTAYDPRTKQRTTAHVLALHSMHSERVLRIGQLLVTGNHPLFADGKWTRAEDVQPGTQLFGRDLKPLSFTPAPIEQPGTVYDLSVSEPHTYFAAGLLLHNKAVYAPVGGAQPWGGLFYRRAAKAK